MRLSKLILCLVFLPCLAFAESNYYLGASGVPASTITNYTQDANCMGAWYMNLDAATSEIDRTANGNDLAVSASDTIPQSATVPAGYSGYSRTFAWGDVDYLRIADGTELDINGADQSITLAAWIYVTTAPADNNQRGIIHKGDTGASNAQYEMWLYGTGSSQFEIYFRVSNSSEDGTAWDSLSSITTTLAQNTWYHIVCVDNNTDMRIYINGELNCVPLAKNDGIYNGNGLFYIGSMGGANTISGNIDEPIVLNRALSSTEVAALYANGISGNKGGSD